MTWLAGHWTATAIAEQRTCCSSRPGPRSTGQGVSSCSCGTLSPPSPTWPTFGSVGPAGGRPRDAARSLGISGGFSQCCGGA
eukprot:46777-Alexandrium_andersonii.AAC.1